MAEASCQAGPDTTTEVAIVLGPEFTTRGGLNARIWTDT